MNVSPENPAPPPKARPVFIVAIAVVFIATGLADIWLGVAPLTRGTPHPRGEDLAVLSIGIAALTGGICLFQGRNWARWLLTAWMALHVALSIRDPYALLVHLVIFALLLAGLFHPAAAKYFRRADT